MVPSVSLATNQVVHSPLSVQVQFLSAQSVKEDITMEIQSFLSASMYIWTEFQLEGDLRIESFA